MAMKEKELDQISTTDKLKAFKALKDAGYRVVFNGSGVPTVICMTPDDISKETKKVKKVLKELRYTGSFGVRSIRKTDQALVEAQEEALVNTEAVVETEENKEDSQAIPA